MAHWLYKSEPSTWSWDAPGRRRHEGHALERRAQPFAKLNLMAMKKGEHGFFYHSNEGKAVVGIVEVIKEYYPDHTDETGKFGMVDIKAVKALPKPVTLEEIKEEPRLKDMILVNNSRLSVQPVTDEEWKLICRMGGL